MAETQKLVSSMGKAELDKIFVRGYDLNEQLLGKISFAQMVYLMIVGRMPTAEEGRMIDTMLIVLVDHGMTTGALAARHDLSFRAGSLARRRSGRDTRRRQRAPRFIGILRQDVK